MAKAEYTKPSDRLWQEEQLKNDESPKVLSTYKDEEQPESDGKERELTVEGNQTEAYVGVDPIYQTYANETDAPLKSEKGVESKLEDRIPEQNNVPSREATASEGEGEGDKDGQQNSGGTSDAGLQTGLPTGTTK